MAKKVIVKVAFDDKAEAAAERARKMAGKLITEISRETRTNIRNVVAAAIREGVPPAEAAKQIKGMVGLTSMQGQSVMNYWQELQDRDLPMDKVNKLTDKYANELLTRRGEAIARTEILDALNSGQEAAWQQAQDKGLLSDDATKQLILSPNACEECQGIKEEGPVPIGEEFSEDGPPFHPLCRCTVAISRP